jgi:tetratricopeptide (TPR) repeat protein
MGRHSRTVLLKAVTCILATLSIACNSRAEQHGENVRPVALPDVSRLAAPVQAQVRERHSALLAKLEDRNTPHAELGDAYGELGLILMAAEYYDAAASSYLTAQGLVPSDARWPYYLAHLHRMKGDVGKSTEFFTRALELRPADTPTLIWLGEMYLDQHRPEQAEPLFLRALAQDPKSAAALSGAGRTALAKPDPARAVDYLERALALDPRALTLHYSLAAAYRGLGQLDRARQHLERRGSGRPVLNDPLMEAYDAVLHSPLTFETRGLRAL